MTAPLSVYDFEVTTLEGVATPLSIYQGRVLLLVNTASQCGFTPQFEGLEQLWRAYREQGLVVLGFPCNQFGGQEPGSAHEIANFCTTRYEVTFPMMSKIEVNGISAHSLYQWLTHAARGVLGTKAIKWNFTKFLTDRSGQVVKRYAPLDKPLDLRADIESALGL